MKNKKVNLRDKPENSSMITNQKELDQHSKIMEQMSTIQEIEKQGLIPDPQQYDSKE
ncbi:hypothetical protein ACOI1C_19245 [Bacillus sp. DJP31]|uniref:hypothetical protein n=1 Tax=Bacillus sp. DJP31 TaxID=3409789 RepID=UPI003BB6E438